MPTSYLLIQLSSALVVAAYVSVENGEVTVHKVSGAKAIKDLHKKVAEDVDVALQELGKESEAVNEVVFALDASWLDESADVLPVYKPVLKEILDKLGLHGMGFVVVGESLAQALIKKDTLTSSIIIELAEQTVSLTLVQRGKVQGQESVGASTDVVADVKEGLARFEQQLGADHLPSTFLLCSTSLTADALQEAQQALIDVPWMDHHQFLHQPAIEVVEGSFVIDALAAQAASSVSSAPEMPTMVKGEAIHEEPTQEDAVIDTQEVELLPVEEAELDFGFAPADILPSELPEDEAEKSEPETAVDSSVLSRGHSLPDFSSESVMSSGTHEHPKAHKKHAKHTKYGMKHSIMAGVGGGIVVLLLFFWLGVSQFSKVVIATTLSAKTISQDAKITVDPKATVADAQRLILPGSLLKKEMNGSKTIDTSGIKLVGEKAKGKVTLLNKTDASKTFSSGTVLSTGKLQFTLDQEVTVASASTTTSSTASTTNFGKADGTVTAQAIGADSNVKSGVEMSVGSASKDTYAAVALGDFAGGSSREVRVVSAEDSARARKEIIEDIKKKAAQQFKDEAVGGVYIEPTGGVTVSSAEYDVDAGEESGTITGVVKATVEAISYKAEDLRPLATQVLASQVPSGFMMSTKEPQILSSPVSTSSSSGSVSSKVVLDAQLSAQVVPQVDTQPWKKEVAGKKIVEAVAILEEKSEVAKVEVTVLPQWLTKFVQSLPGSIARITIETRLP